MEETLRKFGLSQSEAKVYLTLLELGGSLAGEISKKSNVNRSNCYDALQRLIEKGLVSFVIKANRKYFQAETPEKFLEIIKEKERELKEKEQEIKEILPELIEKSKASKENPEATIYKGRKGVKSIFEDILRYKEFLVFGSSGKFKETLGPFFSLFQKIIRQNGIKCRLLVSEKVRDSDIVSHAETRFLPENYITLSSTLVYGDKVAVISWTENPVGFVLKDKQVADSYRTYFNFMWKIANK